MKENGLNEHNELQKASSIVHSLEKNMLCMNFTMHNFFLFVGCWFFCFKSWLVVRATKKNKERLANLNATNQPTNERTEIKRQNLIHFSYYCFKIVLMGFVMCIHTLCLAFFQSNLASYNMKFVVVVAIVCTLHRVAIHVEPILLLWLTITVQSSTTQSTLTPYTIWFLCIRHSLSRAQILPAGIRSLSQEREREWKRLFHEEIANVILVWKLLCLLIACCWQTSIRMIWYLHLHLHCHHVYAYIWAEIIEVFEQYIYMHFHEVLNT